MRPLAAILKRFRAPKIYTKDQFLININQLGEKFVQLKNRTPDDFLSGSASVAMGRQESTTKIRNKYLQTLKFKLIQLS